MPQTTLILIAATYLTIALSEALADPDGPPPLKVVGKQLKTPDGKVVRLRGVNIPSMAWGHGENLWKSLDVALDWGANFIRFPLSQDHWFRPTKGKWNAQLYRERVRMFVDKAAAKKCYVLLDLHWSYAGTWGQNIGQHQMPDNHSIAFWKEVAAAFANHPAVLFNLYNEPYGISWKIWRDGGQVKEPNKKAPGGKFVYETPGMQKLLDVCRAAGAKNVAVVGGLDWAYDLTGIAKGFALDDPKGNGVVYDTHIYPMKKWYTQGNTKTQKWDQFVMSAGAKYAVLIGEFGNGSDNYDKKVIDFAEKNGLHWTAWCLHPGAKPCLIKDWKYTPTPFGEVVKSALREAAGNK
jgi:hypothetical protein